MHSQVDIEFFDPKEADFHGIKALLQDLLSGKDFDSSGLADTVIAQASTVPCCRPAATPLRPPKG